MFSKFSYEITVHNHYCANQTRSDLLVLILGSLDCAGFLAHYGSLADLGFLRAFGSLGEHGLLLSPGSLEIDGILRCHGSLYPSGVLADYSSSIPHAKFLARSLLLVNSFRLARFNIVGYYLTLACQMKFIGRSSSTGR